MVLLVLYQEQGKLSNELSDCKRMYVSEANMPESRKLL